MTRSELLHLFQNASESYLRRNADDAPIEKSDNANHCEKESELHAQITADLKNRRWPFFHGSMAHRQMRTLGECDYTILASGGRVFFIECKTKTGKLSPEQLGLKMWAETLGHEIHTVRSFQEYLKVIDLPEGEYICGRCGIRKSPPNNDGKPEF